MSTTYESTESPSNNNEEEAMATPINVPDGATFITTRKARLEFGARKGKEVSTIEEMVAFDGTTIGFRCVDCSYTSDKFGSVFAHRSQHSSLRSSDKSAKAAVKQTAKGMLKEFSRLVDENEKLRVKLESEKKARREAERRLRDIEQLSKKVFKSLA